MVTSSQALRQASDFLAAHDMVLAPVIRQVGPCMLQPHTDYYRELVQSILGQQLSLQAAAAIEARFIALFNSEADGAFPTPQQIMDRDPEELRSAGLSRAKVVYVQDLARHVVDGRIHFNRLDNLSNADIIREFTMVKGIGEWTVHMFLIFCLARLDVLPTGDLGIKNGIRKLYDLPAQPSQQDVADIATANHWHPYASVASWYVWQSLTLKP